jgi:hypothetical protein
MGSSCSVSKRSEIEQSNIIKLASGSGGSVSANKPLVEIKDKPKAFEDKFKDFPEHGKDKLFDPR